jgi:hypothetical protein
VVEFEGRSEKGMGSKKHAACFQMNLDRLRTCARGIAGPEGLEGASYELAVDGTAERDFVEVLEWNPNGWPLLVFVQEWIRHSVS